VSAVAVGTVSYVVVDCADPGRLATFWGSLLGLPEAGRDDGRGGGWIDLAVPAAGGPQLSFVAVPEPKAVKNRLHLDLRVPDLAEATARAERLGATVISEVRGTSHPWRVFADPEGNEFCLVSE
jgi:predicted enzyme related to lactoylglutathione lyase